ncbi:MAG: type II toxin-antitoxin system Phd/YefM family antitoxin [Deltaproteobacteria bacterium]|nr:type II toxin-antitoxin system Phd/YefM family antitoxin [Deltaproteobacteria bacterium]
MKELHSEQFVVDAKGRKVSVLLDVAAYNKLLEDLHDLQVVARRRNNPKLSLKEFKTRLKK